MRTKITCISMAVAFILMGGLVTGLTVNRDAIAEDKGSVPPEAKSQSHAGKGGDTQRAQEPQPASSVIINGVTLTELQIQEFELLYGVTPVPGNYWYDAISGLYGYMGQQASGMMVPGHNFGKLAADASNGDTGVFFNGRELTLQEVSYINILLGTQTQKGRYWLDAYGNCGIEGIAIPLVNFYAASQANSGAGGGDNFWSSNFSAGNYDSDNSRGYVSVPGHGPVGYGF